MTTLKKTIRRRCATLLAAIFVMVVIPQFVVGQQDTGALPDNGFEVPANVVAEEASNANSTNAAATQIIGSKTVLDLIQGGGPLMFPIGLCSFILVVFGFERLISLRRGRIIPNPFAKKLLEQLEDGDLNQAKAETLCERNSSPIAEVFKAGIQKWGRPSVEVEQAVLDAGERQSNHLRRYLRLINGVATICPLLGLLGTVLGMINAFDAIATVDATVGDPKLLIATGISQALLTTAAGMTVAIPALIAYMFFSSRVDQRVMEIDALGMKVVRLVSAEAQLSRSGKGSRSQKAA